MKNNKERDISAQAQGWYATHKKLVNSVLFGIIILIVSGIAYKKFILDPKNKKASKVMFMAEQKFTEGKWKEAFNGEIGKFKGFKTVMKKYDGTKEANLAHFYAGVCELNSGNYKKAIQYLEEFDANGSLLASRTQGCIGDAYAELGKEEKAIFYYEKASLDDDDDVNSPIYLFRKGLLLEKAGKFDKAVETFKELKSKFPQSRSASNIDKYIARAGGF